MSLDTIGSIAIHIVETIANLPDGVSGNMVEIVDMARQHVSNFVGIEIGSNSINATFQPAIVDFAKADTIDAINAQAGGGDLKLAELDIGDASDQMSAKEWRMMGENALSAIGMKSGFSRSVS